jgi:hypothetical protein
VNILIKKAKHIRRYNYTTEQNLEPIEGALEGLLPGRLIKPIEGPPH